MKIEITDNPQDLTYTARIWDGPDGIDYADFICLTLGDCFESIVEFRCMNAVKYVNELEKMSND